MPQQSAEETKNVPSEFRHALIVDDNPAVVTAIATRLMAAGWACLTALDGHDAMYLMSHHPIDVVITDIDMPYVDGFRIVELALSFKHCPVMVMTGSTEAATRCRRDYPGVPLLTKPFTAQHILAFLTTIENDNAPQADAA